MTLRRRSTLLLFAMLLGATRLGAQHDAKALLLLGAPEGEVMMCRTTSPMDPSLPVGALSYDFGFGLLGRPSASGSPSVLRHLSYQFAWDSAGQLLRARGEHLQMPNDTAAGAFEIRVRPDGDLMGEWVPTRPVPSLRADALTADELGRVKALAERFWSRRCGPRPGATSRPAP